MSEGVSELESLRFQNEQLRKDLVQVTSALTELREQNETYRNNFEQVKQALLRVQSENEDLRRMNSETIDAKLAIERSHEEQCRAWRAQVEQKRREFQDLQATIMQPRDMDAMRRKVRTLRCSHGSTRVQHMPCRERRAEARGGPAPRLHLHASLHSCLQRAVEELETCTTHMSIHLSTYSLQLSTHILNHTSMKISTLGRRRARGPAP